MDHISTGYLLAALGVAGSLRLIPLVLEDLVAASKRSLEALGDLIRYFRGWRAELWPGLEEYAPIDKEARVVRRSLARPLHEPRRVGQGTNGELF